MKRTVFIVGAGASTDFSIPLGSELARHIEDNLTYELQHSGPIMHAAMRSGEPGDYAQAARDLAGGLLAARSIDRLIDSRRGRPLVEKIGKVGIVSGIGTYEGRSSLAAAQDHDWHSTHAALSSARTSWIARLFALLSAGLQPDESATVFENVSFITFNYDRCIERYLQLAFRQILDRTSDEANALVRQIPLIHVYGSLGSLPGLDAQEDVAIPFGATDAGLEHMAPNIRTFTETLHDEIRTQVRGLIDGADVLVFLGFAFDPLNVAALLESGPLREDQSVFGTSIGVPPPDLANFRRAYFGERAEGWEGGFPRERLYSSPCAELVNTTEFRGILDI